MDHKKILSGVSILVIDQFSKQLILRFYPSLVIFNDRGALGILPAWVSAVSILILLIYIIFNQVKNTFIYMLLFAGLSNVIDRIFYPGVIDFIAVYNFPVFNFADAVISIIAIYLIIDEFRK